MSKMRKVHPAFSFTLRLYKVHQCLFQDISFGATYVWRAHFPTMSDCVSWGGVVLGVTCRALQRTGGYALLRFGCQCRVV